MHLRTWARYGLLIIVAGCSSAKGQDSDWLMLASLNEPRQEVGVAELDGRIYVAGGFRQDRSTADTVEVYDPQANVWRIIERMPVAVHHPAAAAIGGKLYVLGGYAGQNPTDALQVYDPAEGEWTLGAPLPVARGALIAAVVEDKIYAVGGARGPAVDDLAVYDPEEDTWTSLAPMPTPRDHLGVGVIDGKLYVVGGRNPSSFTLDTLEVYDPATDRWETHSPMPTGRSGHAAAALGGCLYAFGGEGNQQDPRGMFAEVEAYHAGMDNWISLAPMPTPRHGVGVAVVGDRIFLPGGATVQGFGATGVSEAFIAPGCG
jgi:N-acetylneuraminic acid mutarotase